MDTIKLSFSEQDVNVIIQALGELPLKVSGQIYAKIQQQMLAAPVPDNHSDKEF